MSFFKLTLIVFVVSIYSSTLFAAKRYESEGQAFKVVELLSGEGVIWGFDFINTNEVLFTLRTGEAYHYNLKTKNKSKLSGLPKVYSQGQGGLLDVRVKPIGKKVYVYFSYSHPTKDNATTALARGEFKQGKLLDIKTLFVGEAFGSKAIHFGSRIEFEADKYVFLTIGDRSERKKAQDLSVHNGKILRLNLDGSVPKDNPFVGQKGAKPEIWSYGHRNPQGLTRHPETGDLWSTEMGPRGGDEINWVRPKVNYGWPEITYGSEYWGPKIGEKAKEGMEQPVKYYVPSISPSGTQFYNGKVFPKWKNNLFIGNLSSTHLRRIELKDNKVIKEEELLKDKNWRIRNVRTGPDGFLYLSTDSGILARIETF